MFAELPALDHFWIKKDEVAAQLLGLMAHCGFNRASLAAELGWHKSRVTSVLSGKGNPTIRTIWELCRKLDYDFDLVFRTKDEARPDQPWDKAYCQQLAEQAAPHDLGENCEFFVQSSEEVAEDLRRGTARSAYITLRVPGTSGGISSVVSTLSNSHENISPELVMKSPIQVGYTFRTSISSEINNG